MTTQAEPVSASPIERDAAQRKTDRNARRSAATAPSPTGGLLWFGGWLFTVGFAKLVWWKAALALVLWPYFLGVTVR